MTGPLPWSYWSAKKRLNGGPVNGTDLFPDCAGYPDLFAQFVDFPSGLAPTDNLQYQHWREAFRALDPGLPEHPMFDREDRSGQRRWLRWVPGPPSGQDHYLLLDDGGDDGEGEREVDNSKDIYGGPESRSEAGGKHHFFPIVSSEWFSPVALAPSCGIGDELDVVSRHLELIDEPPLYDRGPSVESDVGRPPEIMNNTQSDTQCIRP